MKYVITICTMVMLLFGQGQQKDAAAFDGTFAQFKSSLAGKDYFAAYEKLHSALELFWQKTPLLLRNARFVKDDDNSYGIYEPKSDNSFAPGERLYLYLEPIGYAFKKNPAGYYEFGFSADFTLEDEGGKVLGGQENFAKLDFSSWNHNTEISLTFTYTFTGFEKGKYKVVTRVTDTNSKKSATVDNWFNIR